MGTLAHEIVDNVVTVLENNSYDPLPSTERTGSMWFKEHQDLIFTRQMPKGKVYHEETINIDRTHGANFVATKQVTVNCAVFSRKGETDPTTGKKDRELIQYMLDNVESTLKTNKISNASLVGFAEVVDPIGYDETNRVFIGVLPVTYAYRE